ncbi:MAG: biliverdin-producing heme oxygenase [Luteibacter sp.]
MDGAAAPSSAAASAHMLLREHTRDAHDAAEATAGMRALMSGGMDEAGYRELLAAQRRLYEAWETERASEIAAITAIWPYTSRLPHLTADLSVGAALVAMVACDNAEDPVAPREKMSRASALLQVGAAPRANGFPQGDAAFWGELYVIEGSTLGGQVIVRHLRERFPGLPHAFYAMGEHAPGRWRRFQRVLDDALADEASQRLAIAGAQHMFARFQQTLQDPGHHV